MKQFPSVEGGKIHGENNPVYSYESLYFFSTPTINPNVSSTNSREEAVPKSESTEVKTEIKTEPSNSDLGQFFLIKYNSIYIYITGRRIVLKGSLYFSADYEGLEGATGFTPPKEEVIPDWEDPTKEEHEDEMHEIRRRRLQKFDQEQSAKQTSDTAS